MLNQATDRDTSPNIDVTDADIANIEPKESQQQI